MRRAAVGAAVLAGAAAAGAVLLGRSSSQHAVAPARPLTVQAVLEPRNVQFGDELTARVVALLDDRAGSLRIDDGLAPLTQLGPARITRTRRGRLEVVSVSVPAACLSATCVAKKRITLPPVTVQATAKDGETLHGTASWPALQVGTRVTAADLTAAKPPFRGDALPPPPTYRIAPHTLAQILDVLAGVLAGAGVVLATWYGLAFARRRRASPAADELELALRQARDASTRPARERRRALGLLARLLEARNRKLAGAASELAWSEPAPEPEAVSALVSEIEPTVAR